MNKLNFAAKVLVEIKRVIIKKKKMHCPIIDQ